MSLYTSISRNSVNSYLRTVKPSSTGRTTIRDLTKSDNRILEDRSSADPRRARWTPRYYSSPALASVTPKQAGSTGDQPSQDKKTGWKSMMAMLSLGTLSMGYLLGTSYPPSLMSQVIINSFLQPPKLSSSRDTQLLQHGNSPEAIEFTKSIESQLHQLNIVKQLNSQPERWASFRPFSKLSPHQMSHSLTFSTLRGPGKFAIPPIIFINKDKTESVVIVHVGDLMCGHDGIVHGGLLATICDEGLASLAFSNLPNMIGVTASLKLNYKKPVLANQFIILRTWLPADKSPKGRKVWADGRIENVAGDVLVEAESLFIEPKGANFLLNSQIKEYIKP
ncbi:hypothetical protein Pst134EA_005614 [Puccinia striiformis f. sp. tritici]|uniref:hypothetical protein n=1 Tax=Puccinia striiformis f. sp. tritici TaxID=168172 RepID=UPI00200877E9|nr:hypothetical protein Pst134EA_005614 [Puccinia striiformis f. sp. tritici]KAH9471733.1 hypothetical protein Pst134EA_005614 [Puccinia striiformis f. sp. tritici]